MGDPALADPGAIHDSSWHNAQTQGWTGTRGGYIHYQAAAQLVADNLLDFSHLAFVHGRTIGTRAQAGVRPHIERLESGVRISYTTLNGPLPPFARALSRLPEVTDRFQDYTWQIRGNFFAQDSVIAPAGEGRSTENPQAIRLRTMIAVTPETERTCHYFWSSARNDFNPAIEDLSAQVATHVGKAFEEDRAIIEAQQRVIDTEPEAAMAAIQADTALLQVRWMLDKLLAAEAAGPR